VHVTVPTAVYLLPVTIAGTIMSRVRCLMNLVNNATKGNLLVFHWSGYSRSRTCWSCTINEYM